MRDGPGDADDPRPAPGEGSPNPGRCVHDRGTDEVHVDDPTSGPLARGGIPDALLVGSGPNGHAEGYESGNGPDPEWDRRDDPSL